MPPNPHAAEVGGDASPEGPAPGAGADLVTLEELALAISNSTGLAHEEAAVDANFIMDLFGFDERIIDNVLEREDRQLFYLLEEEGLLSTEREMTTLYDDRDWMTHYWILRKDAIKRRSEQARKEMHLAKPDHEAEDLYKTLPDEAWRVAAFS